MIPSDIHEDWAQPNDPETRCSSQTTEERPLITFALFAYNQEKFIREAIESALLQTYEPMEIILSDDCSTDHTFEIMQEMARNYKGTKKVVARRTRSNLGTFLHVVDVASIAQGQLFILAAGDDVSKVDRAGEIVLAWRSTNAWGFYSRFDRISETGTVVSESENPRALFPPNYRLRHYFGSIDGVEIIHGATSAYDRRLFDYLDVTKSDYILSEDGVLSVLLNMLGKQIEMIDKSLVRYRQNEQSLTNSAKDREITLHVIENDELKIERFARSHANRCELFIRWNDSLGAAKRKLNREELLSDLGKLRTRESWREKALGEKLVYLKNNLDYNEIKWALPRLLPMAVFFRVKAFMKKIS